MRTAAFIARASPASAAPAHLTWGRNLSPMEILSDVPTIYGIIHPLHQIAIDGMPT